MPIYSFYDSSTNQQFEKMMSISEREAYLQQNPTVEQIFTKAPLLHSGSGINGVKPDDAFRDKLREIKKAHSQGYSERSKANINTF